MQRLLPQPGRAAPLASSSLFIGLNGTHPCAHDRVSPIGMKWLADFHFGRLPQPKPEGQLLRELDAAMARTLLRDGVVIHVDNEELHRFVDEILPHITAKFVLVSADGDEPMPKFLRTKYPTHLERLLNTSHLVSWFASNCDSNPDPARFSCIPLGVSQWHGHLPALHEAYAQGIGLVGGLRFNALQPKNDSYWMLSSFGMTNLVERPPLKALSCHGALASLSLCFHDAKLDVASFYRLVAQSRFVLSPHGNGLDSYRTWEALYLGAWVIVKTSSLDVLYEGLPVLIVQRWEDISLELLRATDAEFRRRAAADEWDYVRLYRGFWWHKFRSFGLPHFVP